MIHAIIFANRELGNRLYNRTLDFPGGTAAKIYDICISHGVPDKLTDAGPVLRYQPLDGRYLLTVIRRIPQGNSAESRAHVVCVNFLMDAPEADRFFLIPLPVATKSLLETADKLLALQGDTIPRNLCGDFLQLAPADAMPCRAETPLVMLMMGACHCLEVRLTKQLYLQSSYPAVEELHNLLRVLPPPLRKQLSFHTGCVSARECQDLGICYCHKGILQNILASDFEKGPNTTKYWYFSDGTSQNNRIDNQNRTFVNRLIQIPERIPLYDLLRYAITDWDIYRELSLLVADHPRLEQVLEQLPEEEVLQIIRSGKAGELQLAQLAKAANVGSPVRKAAKAARKNAPKSSRQESRRNVPRASAAHVLRSIKGLLYRNRGLIGVLGCTSVSALNFSAVRNGIGDDLVREILFVAGVAGAGFFTHALFLQAGTPDSDDCV